MEFPCPQELDTKGARLKKNKEGEEWMDERICLSFFATGFTTSLQKDWDLIKKRAMSALAAMEQVEMGHLFVGHLSLSE